MGFIFGKKAYLKDNYNILDFAIVVSSVISWYMSKVEGDSELEFVKAFRALRALRPLKLVSKNEGMKLLVNALLGSIPNLINVMLVAALFYIVFGIIGLQLMMGNLGYCNVDSTLDIGPCEAEGGAWTLPPNHYDDVLASIRTFFEVSTLETWPDIMFSAANSQAEYGKAPSEDARGYLKLLFILFIFVTSFFVMNLLISVIVSQFNEQKLKSEGSANLTDEQKEWVKIQRFMAEVRAPVKMPIQTHPFRVKCQKLAISQRFEWFISIMILLNTLVMCLDKYPSSDQYQMVLDYCNLGFVVIFTVEAIIKIFGFGPNYYFYLDWNKFDFAVVVLSLVSTY
jgi:hypothetical protein